MFRLYRTTICPRWHSNYKVSFEKSSQNVKPKTSVLCINSNKQEHSNNDHKKQHANKQEQRYWDDPHFRFNFFRTSLFETAGWLGTVAVCFNYHVKHINTVIEYESGRSSCLFSNIVRALPRRHFQRNDRQKTVPLSSPQTKNDKLHSSVSLPNLHNHCVNAETNLVLSDSLENHNHSVDEETHLVFSDLTSKTTAYKSEKDKVPEDDTLVENIRTLSDKYSISLENYVGVKNINKNDKKAFRSFQNAARHGSTAGFYNLGLCYQLGKGTRVNLNRAAYCYRKAAMKGHGLASFNLAVFFHKGIGGLPVDTKIAKELLAEAAEKDVPEAQLYFGILFLEEEKWSEAVRVFSNLAKKNIPDAQYYLGLCYENGLGVQRNEKIASELFIKSADKGNKRAAVKLKNNRKEHIGESHFSSKTDECKISDSSSLHPSVSVPELRSIRKSNQNLLKLPLLSYLNLFTPLLIVNNAAKIKDNFCSNEKLMKEYSSTYVSFKPLSSVVMEVKSEL